MCRSTKNLGKRLRKAHDWELGQVPGHVPSYSFDDPEYIAERALLVAANGAPKAYKFSTHIALLAQMWGTSKGIVLASLVLAYNRYGRRWCAHFFRFAADERFKKLTDYGYSAPASVQWNSVKGAPVNFKHVPGSGRSLQRRQLKVYSTELANDPVTIKHPVPTVDTPLWLRTSFEVILADIADTHKATSV